MEISTTRILQFSQQFKKFYARQFAPLVQKSGLSMRELDVLLFLANNPNYDTARDIAEFRTLAKSQVSQAVELLAAEGLLQRTPDANDRRVIHLSITPEGAPFAKEAQEIQARCGQQLFAGLTAEQLLQLRTILEVVLHNGEQLEEVPV